MSPLPRPPSSARASTASLSAASPPAAGPGQAASAGSLAPLAPARRLGLLVLGWSIFLAAGPGALHPDGSPLAFLGLALWAFAARRPGRRAFAVEVLAGSFHGALTLYWIAHVWGPALVYCGLGWGVYMAGAGWILRRLAPRLPLPLTTALAFTAIESLRAILPPPFGMRWLQLGHHAATTPLLAESARLWGPTGLSFVLASLAGLAAALAARSSPGKLPWRGPRRAEWSWGLGPLVVALGYGLASAPPAMEPGPRLLLVQPAFPQWRKQAVTDLREKFLEQLELTREGLEGIRAAGRPAPDLVCWGETMLYVTLVDESLEEVDPRELEVYPWWRIASEDLPGMLANRRAHEELWVGDALFGLGRSRRLLPPGTSFLSGAEVLFAEDGRLEHLNAVALWDAAGVRRGLAGKRYLAPGAETMLGLERLESVRDVIWQVAGYVPDFSRAERTGVLELAAGDGRSYRFGATVCFDNAFLDPYTEPLRRGPLDFHLVVSNEAWYLDSFEMDQMVAFSRVIAIATGRSLVRATNSGVTIALGADGRELARLVREGRDRHVPGTLEVEVPVPARGAGGSGAAGRRTPFVVLEPWLDPGLVLAACAFLLLASVRPGYRTEVGG